MILDRMLLYGVGAALLASLAFGGVQCSQKQAARTALSDTKRQHAETLREIAEQARKAADLARLAEEQRASLRNQVAEAYERGKEDAKRTGDAVAADLRSGNLRLQKQWRGCLSASAQGQAGGSAGEPDGSADLRAASAGRIIGIAAACDAQVEGLQDIIKADRQ